MDTGIISLLSAGLGAGITLLSVYFNNKNQIKRDQLKYQNDLNIERLRIENETHKKYRTELLQNIERFNNILGKIENSLSLTNSVIQSSNNLSSEDFDKKYLSEQIELVELESISIAFFPDLIDSIKRITALHNNYWGNQRLLLKINIKTKREQYISMQSRIIEISNKTFPEIRNIKTDILKISKKIKSKYVA